MTDIREERVKLLEKELQDKNELIAILQGSSLASMLLGSYLHETRHMFSRLSLLLSSHFEICRKKGVDKYIGEITREFDGLQTIHEAIGDALLGGKQRHNVGVEECIHEVINILGPHLQKSRILLNTDFRKLSGNLRVPKREFTNILLNILMNAIDALQEINTGDRLIDIQTVSHSKKTSITIRDNGNGMDNKIIALIWEPGFTTKRGRSGLGMTLAKLLVVESLGGQIEVESKLGEFTKIGIILPEEPEQAL